MTTTEALAAIRRVHVMAASAATGVPAPTAVALIDALVAEASEGIGLDSTSSWDRLGVTLRLPAGSTERGLRALQLVGALGEEQLEAVAQWTQLLSAPAELHVSEPASDEPATISWFMVVGTAPGDVRGLCEALGLEQAHVDTLMARIAALDVARTIGVALVLRPGAPPAWRFRLHQHFGLDALQRRLDAMDATAAATGVSEPQRKWLRAVVGALAREKGTLFAPVELEISSAGVAAEMRIALWEIEARHVLRLALQFGSDEATPRRLALLAAAAGPTDTFEWLLLTARDTEPPGIGFAVQSEGAPGLGDA